MKIKSVLISSAACALLVSACGKDSDSDKKVSEQTAAERWNPEEIEGSFVAVGPWTLRLPTADKYKSYYWEDDESLTKLIESSDIQISAIIDINGTKANFATRFVKDQCENHKITPAPGELGGKTLSEINWFLKNQGSNFENFTATAKKFDSCISMSIRSVDNLPALTENSDVVRYFKAIASKISFDRFIFVHFNVQRIQSFLVTAFNEGMDFSEADGITSGTAQDLFITNDGNKNALVSEAKAGICDNQIFKNAFADPDKRELELHSGPDIDAKYSSKIVSSDGQHNRIVEGVFRNSLDNNCLLLRFSLANPVDSLSVVQDDKELEDKLIFELKVTSLVPKQ
ncbi:hypothetical protein [Oligoflexus tunisiensis]|uniref:hypothetical protein n=1 Tax=Oligoflexus tunisiensis TaxID=708132 RepID=UPI00114CB020|nr:hypothetical protein [Oligoflexus tunisiensis]